MVQPRHAPRPPHWRLAQREPLPPSRSISSTPPVSLTLTPIDRLHHRPSRHVDHAAQLPALGPIEAEQADDSHCPQRRGRSRGRQHIRRGIGQRLGRPRKSEARSSQARSSKRKLTLVRRRSSGTRTPTLVMWPSGSSPMTVSPVPSLVMSGHSPNLAMNPFNETVAIG